jgi:hypothetical protein
VEKLGLRLLELKPHTIRGTIAAGGDFESMTFGVGKQGSPKGFERAGEVPMGFGPVRLAIGPASPRVSGISVAGDRI